MKLLSDAAEYALRAVVWLAGRPCGEPQKVREIAMGTHAAPGYLVKVLQQLARAGILTAQRGSQGGFTLVRDPSELSALEVINAIDPIERIRTCPLGIEAHGPALCPMHRRIDDAIAAIERSLADSTIRDMVGQPVDPAAPLPHCGALLSRPSCNGDCRSVAASNGTLGSSADLGASEEAGTMPEFQNEPINRHDALAPFSRDHYTGLVVARHLTKAASADDVARRKAVAEFVDAWDREIAEHFRDEERLLDDLMSDEDRRRLLTEHERLTELAREARELRKSTDPDPLKLEKIGQLLERHIRWEERELFNRLQERAGEDRLARLHQSTEEIERSRPRNTCRS